MSSGRTGSGPDAGISFHARCRFRVRTKVTEFRRRDVRFAPVSGHRQAVLAGPSAALLIRSRGPSGHVTLRGDCVTAPIQHVPSFRFSILVSKHSAQMLDCFEQDWPQSSSRVQAPIVQEESDRGSMKRPTDDQILTALCQWSDPGPNGRGRQRAGDRYCHRWDFTTELTRVRALLDDVENRDDGGQDRSGDVRIYPAY